MDFAAKAQGLVELERRYMPEWDGFDYPQFLEEENDYKREAAAFAQEQLAEETLRGLIDAQDWDAIIGRLEKVGQQGNLLFLSAPKTGDLGVLYVENMDKPAYCQQVHDLLHGSGPSEARLDRYVAFCGEHELPCKWTFPTLLLFYLFPATDFFVKPTAADWFLRYMDSQVKRRALPNGTVYAEIVRLARGVYDALSEYGPRDLMDVQGLVWTAYDIDRRDALFLKDLDVCLESYPESAEGRALIGQYGRARESARAHHSEIIAAADAGEDVTTRVLHWLLPYQDCVYAQDVGAWVHWAPVYRSDPKRFVNRGQVPADAWPNIARAILAFVRSCVEQPEELASACAAFLADPAVKGFQCGALTPILNALAPEHFALINAKPIKVLDAAWLIKRSTQLADYAVSNRALRAQVAALESELAPRAAPLGLSPGDLFDMYCHWAVAVKPSTNGLAEPFKSIFGTWEEANGAFDLMRDALERLGVEGPEDQRFAVSVPQRADPAIHLDFGMWLVLGFEAGSEEEGASVRLVIPESSLATLGDPTGSLFDTKDSESRTGLYWFPVNSFRAQEASILTHFHAGLETASAKFGHWKATTFRGSNVEVVARAIFDPSLRSSLLAEGLEGDWGARRPTRTRQIDTDCYFSARTFELLGEIKSADDSDWFESHSKELERWLVQPLYHLADSVLGLLPAPVADWFRRCEQESGYRNPTPGGSDHEPQLVSAQYQYRAGQDDVCISISLDADSMWVGLILPPAESEEMATFGSLCQELAARIGHTRHSVPVLQDELLTVAAGQEQGWAVFHSDGLYIHGVECSRDAVLQSTKLELSEHIARLFEYLFPVAVVAAEGKAGLDTVSILADSGSATRTGSRDGNREKPKVWWVNMGQTLDAASDLGCLWAPLKTTSGKTLYHWETLAELAPGDIVLHCADQAICAVSKIESAAQVTSCPGDLEPFHQAEEGRLARAKYHFLDEPVAIGSLQDRKSIAGIRQGPLSHAGRTKPGYLFRFTREALSQCVRAAPDAGWPEYALTEVLPLPLPPVKEELSLEAVSSSTGFSLDTLQRWVRAIERKGQAVLYGPPGTGKTFIAEHLAGHLIGGRRGFGDLVQFHPAYAYEDFIQGLRPESNEGQLCYEMVPGRLLEFVRKAERLGPKDICVLIIDEINRANLSRVLGELMYLLEYRDQEIPLSGGSTLRIPPNVRIIGTMNTADRSIALVDHALRRRFAFLKLAPEYELLTRYHQRMATGFDTTGLIQVLKKVNREIGDPNYSVGITFFMRTDLRAQIADIWQMEIEPYLEEFFFGSGMPDDLRWNKVEATICPSVS